MTKGYIFKLSFRPYTLEQACRVRYYIKTCAQAAVLKAIEDLNLSIERVLLNCEFIMQPPMIDYEQATIYKELQEISHLLQEPIYNMIAGACSQMTSDLVLNITTNLYDHNQLFITYEVYQR